MLIRIVTWINCVVALPPKAGKSTYDIKPLLEPNVVYGRALSDRPHYFIMGKYTLH